MPYTPKDYTLGSVGFGRVWSLNVGDIDPDPAQARRIFEPEKLRELSESIKEFGVIQPLIVRKTGNRFTLIAGERRLRAAAMAGLNHVPCIVSLADEEKAAYMALIENLQRRDLDCFEEAAGLARLISAYGLSREEAARKLGKSQSAVANKLRLLKLSGECISAIRRAGLSERHARELLRLSSPEEIISAVDEIKAKKLSVAKTEKYVSSLLASPTKNRLPTSPKPKTPVFDRNSLILAVCSAVEAAKESGISAELSRDESFEKTVLTVTVNKIR
ncbi:MAG: ParB/RepB/Spo0J family partition protein [Clostridia bacterium]|nr:ParB/RepB/Spo0J family partition protein [Clostridia bacterium]